jgi:hypothetical protein
MIPLHKIPKEIKFIVTDAEKQGLRYLRSLGYTEFRPNVHGNFDIRMPNSEWLTNVTPINFADYASEDDPQFSNDWITRR